MVSLAQTIYLGLLFTMCQKLEYEFLFFRAADNIYGSCFYLATGFHGFHVIVGTTLLIGSLIRQYYGHYTPQRHTGFIAAVWY